MMKATLPTRRRTLMEWLRDRLANEDGIGDPLLAIGTLLLTIILFLSGSVAMQNFQNSGRDTNTMNDLNNASTAEASYQVVNGTFVDYASASTTTPNAAALEGAAIGFQPAAGAKMLAKSTATAWTLVAVSDSKSLFARVSTGSALYKYTGAITWTGTPGNLTATATLVNLQNVTNWKAVGSVDPASGAIGGTASMPSFPVAITATDLLKLGITAS